MANRVRPSGNNRLTLGLLVDWFKDPYQNAVFSAIVRACAEFDVNLLCATGGNLDPNDLFWSQRNILYELIGPHNVDGLIAMGGNIGNFIGPARLEQYLKRYRPLHAVCIAYKLQSTPSVLVDNTIGLREVIEHLVVAHGYRRIAFIRGPAVNEEAEQRYAVYCDVLQNHSIFLDKQLVLQGDFNRLSGLACMRELLDRKVKFDAIVAANDLMALGALEVLNEHAIRVPHDVALAGFDDVDDARMTIPQLTTVRQPFRLIGREAVRIALAQIRGETVPNDIRVPSQAVIRASCGCKMAGIDDAEVASASVRPHADYAEIKERVLAGFAVLSYEGIDVDRDMSLSLFEAVIEEVNSGVTGRFATMLAELVGGSARYGLAPVSRIVNVIFATLKRWASDDAERRRRIETILKQVRASIGEMAELAQGQQRVRLYSLILNLSEAAKALMGSASVDDIRGALRDHLPRLNVPACTVSLYADPAEPLRQSRLEFAYNAKEPECANRVGEVFETQQLAPEGLLFSDLRQSIVLEPLFFEQAQLGILTLTMGPEEGVVYEAIRDELSGAMRSVELMTRVVQEVKRRQALEKEQADKEMRIAANIQTMILPQAYRIRNLDVAATMVPAVNVGGDYYDIHPTAEGCWFGIGDVAGHGLRSGLIMLMLQSAVSGLIKNNPRALPKDVICQANAVLYENVRSRLNSDEHMTLCLLRFTDDGLVQFAGAHEELLVLRANSGRCESIATEGMWSGILPDVAYATKNQELRLQEGDLLVLYTDGLVEACDIRGRYFGLERLKEEVERAQSLPVAQICAQLISTVRAWMSSQQDDLTLVVAKFARNPDAWTA